ncbi:hypothetical protein DXG01_000796 [Tephrocybe rancida]|nr:hypothetical protein DXG01_000796 [Tephrocybe rancida]
MEIEAWTGVYFRNAELWEVGCYVLIPHNSGVDPFCNTLNVQIEYLELFQHHNDSWEQTALHSGAQEYEMSQGCPQMQNDTAPDEELITGEVPVMLGTSTLIADNPGIDDIPNNHRFGIIAECPDGDSLDAAYVGRLEEQFHRAATLGDEALREMDPDTMDNAEDDDQLESDDPEVVAPIPLLHSGIEDRQRVPTSDALNNSYTFFTMAVLDDFRLSNFECKSSAYQYWNKISQAGAPATSSLDVDDFYWELRWLS